MSATDSKQEQGDSVASDAPRGGALRSYLAGVMSTVEELEKAVQSLPRVDEKGGSDCPFAEDLYAKKEQLEAALGKDVAMLQAYMAAIQKEVARCERNLQRIRGDAGKLSTPEAIDAYGEAEQAADNEHHQAVTDRDAIVLVLPRAQAVLAVSQNKKYPDKKPQQRQLPEPASPTDGKEPTRPRPDTTGKPALGGELGDLLSIGPLKTRGFGACD